ncbi:MAG: hypothetical protein RBR15_01570 [Sphaerochaeta sp.]|nr:hypothetical protein [Sphaerochaeta sp.]
MGILKKTKTGTIHLLLVFVLALFGVALFAEPVVSTGENRFAVRAEIFPFASFGLSSTAVEPFNFFSKALFEQAVSKSLVVQVDLPSLANEVPVGYLSGINNTNAVVELSLDASLMVSSNNSYLAIQVKPNHIIIPAARVTEFGLLENAVITIQEREAGASQRAPAGKYTAIITISIKSGS